MNWKILSVLAIAILLIPAVALSPVKAESNDVGILKPESQVINIHTAADTITITYKVYWLYIGDFSEEPWSQYKYLVNQMAPKSSSRYTPPCQAVYIPSGTSNYYLPGVKSVSPITYSVTASIPDLAIVESENYGDQYLVAFPCNEDGSGGWTIKVDEWNRRNFKTLLPSEITMKADRSEFGYIIPNIEFSCTLYFGGEAIAYAETSLYD